METPTPYEIGAKVTHKSNSEVVFAVAEILEIKESTDPEAAVVNYSYTCERVCNATLNLFRYEILHQMLDAVPA